MTAPAAPHTEAAAKATPAPAVIHLGPPPDLAPKKEPKRQRPHVKRTRYSTAELVEFERRARDAGLSEGAYTRARTLGDPGPRSRRTQPTPDRQMYASGLIEQNRIGGNINQQARALNTLVLFAEENGCGRLIEILTEIQEANRKALAELSIALAANLALLGYDSQG